MNKDLILDSITHDLINMFKTYPTFTLQDIIKKYLVEHHEAIAEIFCEKPHCLRCKNNDICLSHPPKGITNAPIISK